jgi:glycerophosphoryl diester phosphodiesterase
MKKNTKKVIIAHRGAPGYLPEHTLEGVKMAHSWGVDYIEPDVVLTKDSHAIIMHDIYLDTTSDVASLFPDKKRSDNRFYVADFNLSEIKELKLHERIDLNTGKKVFSGRFESNGEIFRIPTLIEYVEEVQSLNKLHDKDIGVYPELKKPEFHFNEGLDIAKVVFKILDDYGYNKENSNVFVQCFYPPTLKRLREEFKAKMPMIALLTENEERESSVDYDYYTSEKGIAELSKYVQGIGPKLDLVMELDNSKILKSNLVLLAKKYDLQIHAYTHRSDDLHYYFSNDDEFFKTIFLDIEVDGIFTDFANTALKHAKSLKS